MVKYHKRRVTLEKTGSELKLAVNYKQPIALNATAHLIPGFARLSDAVFQFQCQ